MKLIPFITINLALFSASVFSNTIVSSCPNPNTIENINYTFSATNTSGSWIGVATQGNSGSITSFREAVIYHAQPLKLNKCAYNLENGVVDLYLGENRDREISISNYRDSWLSFSSGWFTYFECRGAAEDCKFEFEN